MVLNNFIHIPVFVADGNTNRKNGTVNYGHFFSYVRGQKIVILCFFHLINDKKQ